MPMHLRSLRIHAPHLRHLGRRGLALLVLCVLMVLLLSVDTLYAWVLELLRAAQPVIAAHPLAGGALFVALSALSAMLAFVSSALLVPVAVYAWGRPLTVVLLWLGWMLGGMCAYALGRFLGRPLLRTLSTRRASAFYLERLPATVDWRIAFLLQLALPSEIPGYLFGTLRVRFRTYLLALSLAELPYAAGTVWLGESIIRREAAWLLGLVLLGVGVSLCAVRLLHARTEGR